NDVSYTVKRSRRRTIALHVAQDATVTVRVPFWTPGFMIARFVAKHNQWLRRTLERIHSQPQSQAREPSGFVDGSLVPIWGENHRLHLRPSPGREARWAIEDARLTLYLAPGATPARSVSRIL